MARSNYTRPFANKISVIEKPLEPEPRIKLEVPKPEPCEDPQKVEPDLWLRIRQVGKT